MFSSGELFTQVAGFGVYEPRFYGYFVNEICHVKFIDMLWFLVKKLYKLLAQNHYTENSILLISSSKPLSNK